MSENRTSKRSKKIAIVTAALMLGIGGTAYAYWTQMGAGTGAADTGNTSAVTVTQTSTITGLYPGGTPVALAGKFNNPNASAVKVGVVTATVTETDKAGCQAGWYKISGTATPASQELASGNEVGGWTGLNIALENLASVNQDACKGAKITITYAVAAAA